MDRFDQVEETEPQNIEAPKKETPSASGEPIRVKAILTYKGVLQVEQDPHIGESVRSIGEDVWEVDFLCPPSEWSWAVRFFFRLGLDARVIEPEGLRKEIYQLASQLQNQYSCEREED